MQVERLPREQARGHLLLHNVVDADGRRLIRKGVQLTDEHINALRKLGHEAIDVAILEEDDVWEDEAAAQLAEAIQTPEMSISWGVGGRANLKTAVHGVLYVNATALVALNQLPGITLATLPPHAIVTPERGEDRIATIKIIPYAVPQSVMDAALKFASVRPGLLEIRPLTPRRVALLIIGDPAAHVRLRRQFENPIRQRLLALNSDLEAVESVAHDELAIGNAVNRLLPAHDALILAGQTSIMDMNDLTLRALRSVGADVAAHGAPVDPGNLLALAYRDGKAILCAPGCARSLSRNVMDLVLPRLLAGEHLSRADIAALSLGGLLA
jgi:hypothetical protein